MKRFIILLALLAFFESGEIQASMLKYKTVNFNFFYYELSPYGEWIELDADLIVWRPSRVGYQWSPYTIGRWEWTTYGWYWDSFEPFGWITYHYGRWIYDEYYGWIWVPDYQWAPAWVEWRYDDNYIGWAPLPPYASFHVNVGIRFSVNWHHSYNHWRFVTYRKFCSPNVSHYFIAAERVRRFYNRTTYRTNYDYRDGRIINRGINRSFVERRAGRSIAVRTVQFSNSRDALRKRKNNDVIRVFEPNRKTIEKYGEANSNGITRGKRTSLMRDKIAVSYNKQDKDSKTKIKRRTTRVEKTTKNYSPDRLAKGKRKPSERTIKERRPTKNKRELTYPKSISWKEYKSSDSYNNRKSYKKGNYKTGKRIEKKVKSRKRFKEKTRSVKKAKIVSKRNGRTEKGIKRAKKKTIKKKSVRYGR